MTFPCRLIGVGGCGFHAIFTVNNLKFSGNFTISNVQNVKSK